MGTQKWSKIKKLGKATEEDRAEARAELEAEIGGAVPPPPRTMVLDHADERARVVRFPSERTTIVLLSAPMTSPLIQYRRVSLQRCVR